MSKTLNMYINSEAALASPDDDSIKQNTELTRNIFTIHVLQLSMAIKRKLSKH